MARSDKLSISLFGGAVQSPPPPDAELCAIPRISRHVDISFMGCGESPDFGQNRLWLVGVVLVKGEPMTC